MQAMAGAVRRGGLPLRVPRECHAGARHDGSLHPHYEGDDKSYEQARPYGSLHDTTSAASRRSTTSPAVRPSYREAPRVYPVFMRMRYEDDGTG